VVQDIAALISHPRCASVAGKTSLRELFALYSVSDILRYQRQRPGHFASMTPVDSIVLFGPKRRPYSGPRETATRSGINWAVAPGDQLITAYRPGDDAVCMKSITVAQVCRSWKTN
jgi:ADP-heptose:LPS heptosyltransferase